MNYVEKVARKIEGKIPGSLGRLRLETGIISFTFDDIPQSAYLAGGEILAQHGILGTYYIAGGLTDTMQHGLANHSADLVRQIHGEGHEIGSHAYSHVQSAGLSVEEFGDELDQNDAFLADLLGGDHPHSLAYPFGSNSLSNRRVAMKRFLSSRGIQPGLNRGICDPAQLRANALYTAQKNLNHIDKLIETAAEKRAWLVFYTHDVSDEPTQWGATLQFFKEVTARAAGSGCQLLTMKQAALTAKLVRPGV
jgi:peptidoglycan/xylan/chitin deacetylase (PgdA/CDA1 family)